MKPVRVFSLRRNSEIGDRPPIAPKPDCLKKMMSVSNYDHLATDITAVCS